MKYDIRMSDIRKLDPQLLLVFEAIMDTQSATLTAARLNLSQSAVSGALKRLREILGDPLFERRSHGLTPTKHAEDLSAQIGDILAGLRNLTSPHVFDPTIASGLVTFLATDFAIATLLAPFRDRLRKEAPGIKVAFRPFSGSDVASLQNLNAVDFIIGSPGMLPENYSATPLKSDPLMLFMSPDHPLADRPISIEDLTCYPHVLISLRGNNTKTLLDEILEQRNLIRNVTTFCYSFLTLPILLNDAQSLALAPKSLIHVTEDKLISKTPPVSLPDVKLSAAWHHRVRKDPQSIWIRKLLKASQTSGLEAAARNTV